MSILSVVLLLAALGLIAYLRLPLWIAALGTALLRQGRRLFDAGAAGTGDLYGHRGRPVLHGDQAGPPRPGLAPAFQLVQDRTASDVEHRERGP